MTKDKLETKITRRKSSFRFSLIIIFLGILAVIFLKTSFFEIKNVEVKNNYIVSKDEIVTLANVRGENIFLINKKKITENIANNPYVKEVKIQRSLPDEVIIDIKEKDIKGLIKLKNSFINVDGEGNMIQIVNQFPNCKLPLIEGVKLEEYEPNKSIIGRDENKLKALKSVLTLTDYKEYKKLIYSINISDPFNIKLTTINKMEIYIGDWNNMQYKLELAYYAMKNPALNGKTGVLEVMAEDGTVIFKTKEVKNK
ncbi:cell division protein FtsQ/DivIB [Fervidicella metallireducens]|nr:FtsQ-type POTRA domain-containing protein [Fervidicella metallireducens]